MSSSLEARVARLERHNRRLRAALVLLGTSLVTCGGGVSSNFELVRTRRLVVVDAAEQPRISMSEAGIVFHDGADAVTLDAATARRVLAAPQ